MDIRAGITTAAILVLIAGLFALRGGLRSIQAARKLTFYRLRQARISAGWWTLALALFLFSLAAWLPSFGLPIAFKIYPPSPTVPVTLTPSIVPTITLSPTITLTPTITDTPLVSDTPTPTGTPFILPAIEVQFISVVTPNPEAVISPLVFSTAIDKSFPVNPADSFTNPIPRMYAFFSYDGMLPGVQWTAIWYRNGEYVFHETYPWDAVTGGYYYSECIAPADGWLPGVYTVNIFVGLEFKRGGTFLVAGAPAPAASTLTPSPTLSPTPAP